MLLHTAMHACMYGTKVKDLWFSNFSKEILISDLYTNRIPHESAFTCKVEWIKKT